MTSSDRWRRIEEVFTSALDVPPEQRDAYLNSACAEDATLRAEVESLLVRGGEESPVISSIIEGAAAGLFDEDAPRDAMPDAMLDAELGNYRIIREIGRGGMGAVYLAVRADHSFEKQVAIKLVKRGIDTDAVLQRFWYERRILAGLEHTYIARLVDGGTSPDGRPYFVMEYVDGQPLDAYVREQGLSIQERCELFRKICEAISYAHRNLIIHRDLKPANVLVTADGRPKLLDFGIARLLSVDPGEHTIAGPIASHALTPAFASPEQLRGEAVTTATDVYSLGATLRAILPSDSTLPSDLATIIGKAMREEVEQRFASVADLSEDLRRYLAGLPILAREQTLAYQAGKFVRRHRVGVSIFALANALLVAAIGAIVWESHRADIQRREAEQRLSQAVGMADQILKDVNGSIASLPGTTEARRQMVRTTLEYLNKLSKDSGGDPRVLTSLATAYVRVGEVLGNSEFPNLGDLHGSLATYQRALGVIQPLADQDPRNLAIQLLASQAHQGIANILDSLGKSKEADAEYRTAIHLADQALALKPDDPDLQFNSVDTHYALDMVRYSAEPQEAERDARLQLPVALKLVAAQPGDPDKLNKLSEIYSLLGIAANRQSRLTVALDYFRKAAEVREAIYFKNPRNTRNQRNLLMGYGHIGDALGNPFTTCLGDYSGALEYYTKAARIADDMSRADPSDQRAGFDIAMIWTRMGATRQAAGDPNHAIDDLNRAVARFGALMANSPGNSNYEHAILIAYDFLGRSNWLLDNSAEALKWDRKSLELTEKLLAARPNDIGARVEQVAVQCRMGPILAFAGDRAGAIRIAEAAVANSRAKGMTPLNTAYSLTHYARTYEVLNDYPTAATAYAKAAEMWKQVPGVSVIPPLQAELRNAQRKAAECRRKIGPKASHSPPGAL